MKSRGVGDAESDSDEECDISQESKDVILKIMRTEESVCSRVYEHFACGVRSVLVRGVGRVRRLRR